MSSHAANSNSAKDLTRCNFHTANGRRCRTAIFDPSSPFCFSHARLHLAQQDTSDLTSDLAGDLKEFKSAMDINTFLSNLLLNLSGSRVSNRRAAVLTYICQQLLRTLPVIDKELGIVAPEDQEPEVIFDIPRPDRSQLVSAT